MIRSIRRAGEAGENRAGRAGEKGPGEAGDKTASGYETMEGSVTGTLAYMAPEQARGEVGEIDERSDIYSLGAVLFELLTGRPPFVGETPLQVLFQVILLEAAPDPRIYRERVPIPDDLADICVKAMAPKKEDRYASVEELLGDVIAAIEGGKERERRHQLCLGKLREGRELQREYRELGERIGDVVAAEKEQQAKVEPHHPVASAGKQKLQELRAELQEARVAGGQAFNRTVVALTEALAFEPGNEEVRRELAEFHYHHMVKAERQRDRKMFEFHKAQVESLNDGEFDERLRGDGRVSLETTPSGAEAYLFRYEEAGLRLVAKPYGAGEEGRGSALEGNVGKGSETELGHALGATPLGPMDVPMGSYLLILKKEGYRDTRVPFLVSRLEEVKLSVRLYKDEEVGEGMVYVPGGKFLMGEGEEMGEVEVEDFFIGKFPVTFGEYCRYLDWLEENEPAEVKERAPQNKADGLIVKRGADGKYFAFDPTPPPGASGELDSRTPVLSIIWFDAKAYCAWLSRRDGQEYRLPTEREWEKACRGTDGRMYPWGNGFDATYCKMSESTGGAHQPESIGRYETDESPYGVRDMAGGVQDWCEDWFDDSEVYRAVRGGGWHGGSGTCRAAYRYRIHPTFRVPFIGFRVAVGPPRTET